MNCNNTLFALWEMVERGPFFAMNSIGDVCRFLFIPNGRIMASGLYIDGRNKRMAGKTVKFFSRNPMWKLYKDKELEETWNKIK